jgi:hypothetical protein
MSRLDRPGVKVRGQPSEPFLVVSKYCQVRRGCQVSTLSRAEVQKLCGQVKNLLSRGLTRAELEEAIDRLDRDPWYREKKWGFKAVEKEVLHTRMVRERQVPRIQPLPDPMETMLERERRGA